MNLRGLGSSAPQARGRTVEVEVRFRVDEGALDALIACGISFGSALRQDDQAYAPRGWRYGDNRIGIAFARLRTQLDEHLFTVKRPITDVRTCVETECVVSDRAAMHEALELMGFAPTVRIVKTRRSAQHGQLTFCFDELDGVGSFVEVEMLACENDDLDAVRAHMEGLLGELGIVARPCFDSYDTLVYEASREQLAPSA
jgi:adenylate cyclase, class 2